MKKILLKSTAGLMLASALLSLSTHAFGDAGKLTFDVYNAGQESFHVNAVVITGDTETLLIDTGFTKADALRIAAKVLDTGKPLKGIFISQADPDFYFGAEWLLDVFPNVPVITTPAVREVIEKKMAGKVDFWGPKLGDIAPVKPVLPGAYSEKTLTVDDHTIEIRGL